MIGDLVQEVKTLPGFTTMAIKPLLTNAKNLPAASFLARNGVGELFYKGSEDLKTTNVDFSIYTTSYDELRTLQTTFVNYFHGFSGLLNNNSYVAKVEVTNTLEMLEEHNQTIYRVIIFLELTQ